MSCARFVISRGTADFSETAAAVVRSALARRLSERPLVTMVLAGGETPLPMYRRLAGSNLEWNRVELFFGDERAVGAEHDDSNYRAVSDALGAVCEQAAVHRIRGELGSLQATREYQRLLERRFGGRAPDFDVVILGVGSDGHTASLFRSGIEEREEMGEALRYAVATTSPVEPRDRISLSFEVLCAARDVVFLAVGDSKAEVVSRCVDGDLSLPAGRVATAARSVSWILDPAAARRLPVGGLDATRAPEPSSAPRR